MEILRRYIVWLARVVRRFAKVAPLVRVEVSKSALLHNFTVLQKIAPNWAIAPVLKANAYGHGIVEVAEIFQKSPGVPFFAVDSYFEAVQLSSHGITKPILILGYSRPETIQKNSHSNSIFTISSIEQLEELVKQNVIQRVHIKFDTGMHRQGISWEKGREVISLVKNCQLQVKGILSHFADAETKDSMLTETQIARWNELVSLFKEKYPVDFYHLANSAGFAHAAKIDANVGRSGIALYGINPGNLAVPLRPVLRMVSLVSGVRELEQGESVGYNGTYVTDRNTKLALVPAGYFEGVDRRLSNTGAFTVRDELVPIRGRVSMNISLCDVSGMRGVGEGTEVVIFSNNREDENSVESVARKCSAIPYEILVHIPAHLRRVVVA